MKNLITGTHLIVSSSDPASDRAFFRDVLGFESVDAGGGWLIFALPPAELAFHPGTNGEHQLYLMTADLDATLSALKAKGVPMRAPISEQAWGRLASIVLPGGGELFIYQPAHPSPVGTNAKPGRRRRRVSGRRAPGPESERTPAQDRPEDVPS